MTERSPTFRVFLSSTSEDLTEYREAVSKALRKMQLLPVQMETFGARPGDPVAVCQQLAADADLVVVLVAWRCGWVPETAKGGTGDRSITRLEVEAALDARKPVLAFLAEAPPSWTGSREADALYGATPEKQQSILAKVNILRSLREWLGKSYVRDTFTTPDNAATNVVTAVHNHLKSMGQAASGGGAGARVATTEETVEAWLRRVAEDHAQLVSWFDDAEFSLLDHVYVELDVGLDERVMRHLVAPGDEDCGRRELASLLTLDRAAHPWVTQRWVVLGNPGAGKTTMVRRLVRDLARDGERRWVPVFVSLPEMLRDGHLDPLAHSLSRLAVSGPEAESIREALVARGGERGDILFVLDGLDELSASQRPKAQTLLRDLEFGWPSCPIIVTSRAIAYQRPAPSFREVRVQDLDPPRAQELLARWFGRHQGVPDDDRAREEWAKIADPALADLTSNPMYLTLLALLLEEGGTPQRNRAALYDQVFQLLYEGRHHHSPKPMPGIAVTHEVLCWLALRHTEDRDFFQAERVDVTEDRLLALPPDLKTRLNAVSDHQGKPRDFLEILAARAGIYGPHDGATRPWRYAHRSFREALASEALSRLSPDGDIKKLRAHLKGIAGTEDRWAEPYALLVGRVAKPDDLLRALVAENRALGVRALATAQGVEPETILAILKELSDGAAGRAEVFTRIPDLVGDGERAVALIERIARDAPTLSGQERYFLHEALETLATRGADLADTARRAQSRLYDRISTPPPGLFERIDTADGVAPLLGQVIEGGVPFLMGSPPGDAMAHEDERPQHEVTITRSYQMTAVTVTNAMYRAFDRSFEFEAWRGVPDDDLAAHPAVNVSWYDAVAFCRWLSAKVPGFEGARLPTEAEWERAARGGATSRYWSGDEVSDLKRVGWFDDNSESRTHRVAELRDGANAFGLYDVHGNVWEWTSDWEYRAYDGGPALDPAGPPHGEGRVLRGGSCWGTADGCRAAYRSRSLPSGRNRGIGFRVLLPR